MCLNLGVSTLWEYFSFDGQTGPVGFTHPSFKQFQPLGDKNAGFLFLLYDQARLSWSTVSQIILGLDHGEIHLYLLHHNKTISEKK